MLYFPQSHLIQNEITWTLDELLIYNRSGQSDEDYHCIHCKRRTVVTRKEEIIVYPKLLLIVLCRRMAEENTDNINVVNTAVEFPLEDFCFSTISNVQEQSSVDLSYNLIGTVDYKARKTVAITQLIPREPTFGTVTTMNKLLSSNSRTGV